ncbi:hypothetical protein BVZ31_14645 [Alcaligenes faecalis]|nr:hypothetical protein BVZ30_17220 [Alcaligenes faecalis]OSZ48711.1 hypothetical protein BVZ31_14645 [Alcaligenes faecalis]OSZ54196.1 hypothetical protein BVZ32_05565 [Alcaligenes faecalis]
MPPILNQQQAQAVGAAIAELGRIGAMSAKTVIPDGEGLLIVRLRPQGLIIVRKTGLAGKRDKTRRYSTLADFAAAHAGQLRTQHG